MNNLNLVFAPSSCIEGRNIDKTHATSKTLSIRKLSWKTVSKSNHVKCGITMALN